ncbi:hypothetical protein HU200_008349 [Digitaria exilis]|uniref:PHD finger protein ALFIN-LIKE n=1 Tax=Digitaria exilis TaxID=1010633 RepID=A0A835FLB1_9POAL|nr:hypothetical protein HU200_008349 [Digitaria exilis]
MDFPPPLFGSSPRSPVPSRPMHGQGTGAPTGPPPPLPASSTPPAQTPLNGQATGAPMETPAPRRLPRSRGRTPWSGSSGTSAAAAPPSSEPSPKARKPSSLLPLVDLKERSYCRTLRVYVSCVLLLMVFPSLMSLNALAEKLLHNGVLFIFLLSRKRLSAMMKSLQTVHATFITSDTYRRICHLEKMNEDIEDEDEGCGDEPTKCGACGDHYHANAFWIGCDVCDRWFHGKCVNVTSAEAEHIGQYECPECFCEKKGHDYNADPRLSALYK